MSKVNNYRNKIYNHYRISARKNVGVGFEDYQRRCKFYKSRFKDFLPKNKDAKILDLGCGEGFFLYFMHKLGYKNLHAVEKSPEQINQLEKLDIKIKLFTEDMIEFLSNYDEKYDFVLMDNVLEHFNKDEIIDILTLVHKNLDSSGILLISVPNAGSLWGLPLCYIDITHEVFFSPSSLVELLISSNFKLLNIRGESPIPLDLLSSIRSVFYYPLRFLFKVIIIIMTGGAGRTKINHIQDPSFMVVVQKA